MIFKNIISDWAPSMCISCGRRAKENPLCTLCRKISPRLTHQVLPHIHPSDSTMLFFTLFEYQKIRSMLHAIKHRDSIYSLNLFSQVISTQLKLLPLEMSTCIAPLPMNPNSKRSFNQAEELIKPFAKSGGHVIKNIFTRVPESKKQKSLSSRQRFKNISSTLFLNDVPREETILLFDDIITTGATMRAAYELLRPLNKNILIASLCYNR